MQESCFTLAELKEINSVHLDLAISQGVSQPEHYKKLKSTLKQHLLNQENVEIASWLFERLINSSDLSHCDPNLLCDAAILAIHINKLSQEFKARFTLKILESVDPQRKEGETNIACYFLFFYLRDCQQLKNCAVFSDKISEKLDELLQQNNPLPPEALHWLYLAKGYSQLSIFQEQPTGKNLIKKAKELGNQVAKFCWSVFVYTNSKGQAREDMLEEIKSFTDETFDAYFFVESEWCLSNKYTFEIKDSNGFKKAQRSEDLVNATEEYIIKIVIADNETFDYKSLFNTVNKFSTYSVRVKPGCLTEKKLSRISDFIANKKVANLDISHNNISVSSYRKLFSTFGSVKNELVTLDISYSPNACSALILEQTFLKGDDCHVATLKINGMHFGYEQLHQLAIVLKKNKSLKILDFSYSSLDNQAIEILLDILDENNRIVTIRLNGCQIDSTQLKKITDRLTNNKLLKFTFLNEQLDSIKNFFPFELKISTDNLTIKFSREAFECHKAAITRFVKLLQEENIDVKFTFCFLKFSAVAKINLINLERAFTKFKIYIRNNSPQATAEKTPMPRKNTLSPRTTVTSDVIPVTTKINAHDNTNTASEIPEKTPQGPKHAIVPITDFRRGRIKTSKSKPPNVASNAEKFQRAQAIKLQKRKAKQAAAEAAKMHWAQEEIRRKKQWKETRKQQKEQAHAVKNGAEEKRTSTLPSSMSYATVTYHLTKSASDTITSRGTPDNTSARQITITPNLDSPSITQTTEIKGSYESALGYVSQKKWAEAIPLLEQVIVKTKHITASEKPIVKMSSLQLDEATNDLLQHDEIEEVYKNYTQIPRPATIPAINIKETFNKALTDYQDSSLDAEGKLAAKNAAKLAAMRITYQKNTVLGEVLLGIINYDEHEFQKSKKYFAIAIKQLLLVTQSHGQKKSAAQAHEMLSIIYSILKDDEKSCLHLGEAASLYLKIAALECSEFYGNSKIEDSSKKYWRPVSDFIAAVAKSPLFTSTLNSSNPTLPAKTTVTLSHPKP